MTYLGLAVAVFFVLYLLSKNKQEVELIEYDIPFGEKYKVLIDELAKNLWEGQNYILMKKNEKQYFLQKSKLPYNESYVFIIYRVSSIHFDYYEKVAGVELTYKKTYSITELNIEEQKKIANDFSTRVNLDGNMKY